MTSFYFFYQPNKEIIDVLYSQGFSFFIGDADIRMEIELFQKDKNENLSLN